MSEDLRIENEIDRLGKKCSEFLEKQDYENSILLAQKALDLAIKQYGQSNPDVGSFYSFLGTCYFNKGEYDKSLMYLFKSANIFKYSTGETELSLGKVYNNIANLYFKKSYDLHNKNYVDRNDANSSIHFYRKSLKIFLKAFGSGSKYIALLYNNLAFAYNLAQRKKAALDYFLLSNKIYLKLFGKNSVDAAVSFQNIGAYFYQNKKIRDSIKYYIKSIDILDNISGNKIKISLSYKVLSLNYLALKKYEKSSQLIEKAILNYLKHYNLNLSELVKSNPNIQFLDFLRIKALIKWRIYKFNGGKIKYLNEAYAEYKLLVQMLDRIRQEIIFDGSKNLLSVKTVPIYEKAIEVYIELYSIHKDKSYLDEAFKYSQKSKSISLIEKINDYNDRISSNIPPKLLKQKSILKKKISEIEKAVHDENKKRNKSQFKIDDLRNNLFVLNQKLEELIKKLEKENADYYSMKYDFKIVDSNEIVKQIPDDTMIIEYFLGDENIFAFVFTKEESFVKQIKKSENFNKKIIEYRNLLSQVNISLDEKSILKFKNLSHYFYKVLLKDILESRINLFNKNKGSKIRTRNILIIPDNELNFIPFDSLITSDFNNDTSFKELPYLIKYFNIIFSYSIVLFLKHLNEVSKKKNTNILAFAPAFASMGKNGNSDPSNHFRNSLAPLNYNKKEVKEIAEQFNGEYYFGRDAVKEKFIKNKKRFSVLHFATHSVLDDENSMYSKIVFSKTGNKTDEGFLHTYEIYELKSNYDLVVLSACNTGFGRMIRGEGVMSIARAFASSGSKNVVMSLWQVNDKSTSEIMKNFYRNIAKGEKIGVALRNAKLKYLENSDGIKSLPFYWSPFISFGVNNSLN